MFKNISNKAQETAAKVGTAAQEQIDAIIDEFNAMLPFAEELGLSVASFDIEAGLLPQIKTSLVGSIDYIYNEAEERLISDLESKKLLVALLNAVLMN